MNAPIEDQLRDYFTMVDRMQGPVEPTAQSQDTPTLSLVTENTHDTNESTTEVMMISPDRNEPHNQSRTWMLVAASLAAVALVGGLIVVANRDSDEAPANQPPVTVTVPNTADVDGETAPAPDAEQPDTQDPAPEAAEPETTPDPVVEEATETSVDTAPATSPPSTAVESETEGLGAFDEGRFLDGGTTYRTDLFDQEVTFTIPEEHGESSWTANIVSPRFLTLLALQVPGAPRPAFADPTLEIAPVAEGATVDDVIASIMAYAADTENLELAAESQTIRGVEVTVLRGSSSSAATNNQVQLVPTSSTTTFSIAPGAELVAYVIEGPSQVVVARIESDEEDLEWMIERVAPVLESIEFT